MDINPEYRNNSRELAKITGTIDSVRGDKDVTIQSIFIKGYASPESPYANNERLAKGRTAALKEYVENLYHFDDGLITTDYEPEDWAGLERYVAASNLKHKEEILATIHSEREPDNKEWWIHNNWTDDYNFLLKNCYPALRHSDYTIEYTIRHYTSPREIEEIMNTAPQKLSLDEFYLLAQTYDEGSEELDELFEIAVRMYPNDEVANLNAANSAMSKGDYERALRYLERAGDGAEVQYARGALEVLREDYQAAMPYLEEAKRMGIAEAETTINAIQDYWKVSKR
jgi:tetratricopeptide (TPR) repeat protein